MTYSYSNPVVNVPSQNQITSQYPPIHQTPYYDIPEKKSALPSMAMGALVGAGTGTIIASNKNPLFNKSGEVVETYAKKVFENFVKNSEDVVKNLHNQAKEVLAKIDKITTPEELKELATKNPEAFAEVRGDLNIDMVTKENVKENVKTIKERITAKINNRYQDLKNNLEACWDKEKKVFRKPDSMSDDLYKSVKKSTNGIKGRIYAIYAGIGAAIGAAALFVTYHLLNAKNKNSQ